MYRHPRFPSVERLKIILPSASEPALSCLINHADEYSITTLDQWAMFLAQVAHESQGMRYQRELWGPNKWQQRYGAGSKAKELGNTCKADGFLFRGWGPMQITGRGNTATASRVIYGDERLIDNPQLLDRDVVGILGALWYWQSRDLNKVTHDIKKCTKLINGGTSEGAPTHLKMRRERYKKIYNILTKARLDA